MPTHRIGLNAYEAEVPIVMTPPPLTLPRYAPSIPLTLMIVAVEPSVVTSARTLAPVVPFSASVLPLPNVTFGKYTVPAIEPATPWSACAAIVRPSVTLQLSVIVFARGVPVFTLSTMPPTAAPFPSVRTLPELYVPPVCAPCNWSRPQLYVVVATGVWNWRPLLVMNLIKFDAAPRP